ncbi:MAG: dehydrogenase [Bacteroidia bacterium]|nr:dehydrogenase [Bacteroidia bacterium]
MLIRSKAPLRIGLAGGGTDVSPYSDLYGGAILNATINLYAYTTIEPLYNGKIELVNDTTNETLTLDSALVLKHNKAFELVIGVYNRVVKDFAHKPLSFRLTSHIEAPQGSGLGTSSTIMVSLLGAFVEWLNLPLGNYDIAHLAYEIERVDLAMAGGKQDQYAATFGGINFMEFLANDRVIVNPLQLKQEVLHELDLSILLYYTATQRSSAKIITDQVANVHNKNAQAIDAMHNLKDQAIHMKEALLRGELHKLGEVLQHGWHNKKLMAASITNTQIDELYDAALAAGATGGKISGAGGGGFMFFYCPSTTKNKVARALQQYGGNVQSFKLTPHGLTTWTIR